MVRILSLAIVGFLSGSALADNSVSLSQMQVLGSQLFNDTRLSSPRGQACASCHSPGAAFTDARRSLPVSTGAFSLHFGGRNAPTAMYLKFNPPLALVRDQDDVDYVGGLFDDGRASSLEQQAMGPFVNPLEMGGTKLKVVKKVCRSAEYGELFKKEFGSEACPTGESSWTESAIEKTYGFVAHAIAEFERSDIFSPFSSKYDKVTAGKERFTEAEIRGFEIFKNEKKANCAACHILDAANPSHKALFTDFTYDNIGLPANKTIHKLGHPDVDIGLQQTTKRAEDIGRFKVPTLRNIALTSPYGHNGYFKTLEQVVDFYNTRDVKPACSRDMDIEDAQSHGCWPKAEVTETMNKEELGNLHLNAQEVSDLVAFLKTLSDGYWTREQGWKPDAELGLGK